MNRFPMEQDADGIVHIRLEGIIGIEESTWLRERWMALMDTGCHGFRIHMNQVTAMDSSGLGLLLALHKRLSERNGNVVLVNPGAHVRDQLERANLSGVFQVDE